MKNKIESIAEKKGGFSLAQLLLVVAIIGLLALLLTPARADFTVPTQTTGSLTAVTNQPTTIAAGVGSNTVAVLPIQPRKGLALTWRFNQGGASTSNSTLSVYSRVDGTNASTAPFATLAGAAQGTTVVTINTNWSAAQLEGFDALVVGNPSNSTAITTMTNYGAAFRIPN